MAMILLTIIKGAGQLKLHSLRFLGVVLIDTEDDCTAGWLGRVAADSDGGGGGRGLSLEG